MPATASYLSPSSAVVSGLAPNTLYTFQVVAVDALGNQSMPSAVVITTTPPGA